MSTEVLYGIIGALTLALTTLAGLWVKAHDNHRQWSTQKITEHEKVIAVLEKETSGIRSDVAEIKEMLEEHTKNDRKVQFALIKKFNLEVED